MKYYPYLCLAGQEIANADRTSAYIREGLVPPGWSEFGCFDCSVLNDGYPYISPAQDDAPWYDPNIPESEEFFGIFASRIDVLSVLQRSVKNLNGGGGVVGSLVTKPRLLQFQGQMVAGSELGMAYGDRWLNEVLSGSICALGCTSDEALVLPACPPDDYDLGETHLRRLLDVGIIDGPIITPVSPNLPECHISQITFQLSAGQSYLFGVEEKALDEQTLSTDPNNWTSCLVSTTEWTGDAVIIIKLTAWQAATGIHLKATRSDGQSCPPAEGMPCWEQEVAVLPRDGVLTFDGQREQVRYLDPSLKLERSGIRLLDFNGPLTFVVVPPCADMCISAYVESGDVTMTVEKVVREL